MASLIISRNDQLLNSILPVHIYADDGQLGRIKAGSTEEYRLDDNIEAIQVKNGLLSSRKVPLNKTGDESCLFSVYTHPAIGLIRLSFIVTVLFFIAFLILYGQALNWTILLMIGFPVLILLVTGIVFCRSNYFVIKEVKQ